MTVYIVSHYGYNPKYNSIHRFSNFKDAQEEYMKYDGHGTSWMEIEGSGEDFKCKSWAKKRSSYTSGRLKDKR